jgi:hypothetical protein
MNNPKRGDSGKAQTEKVTEYTRAQFEGAYRSVVQMVHAVGYIDIPEVQRWIMIVTQEDSEAQGKELTQKQIEGRARCLKMFDNLQTFKKTLQETGVPPVPPMVAKGGGVKPSEQ